MLSFFLENKSIKMFDNKSKLIFLKSLVIIISFEALHKQKYSRVPKSILKASDKILSTFFFIRALAHLQHTTVWLNCRSFHRWADFLTSFGFGLREDPLSTHSFSSHFITNTKNVHDCTYITILNVQICTIIW